MAQAGSTFRSRAEPTIQAYAHKHTQPQAFAHKHLLVITNGNICRIGISPGAAPAALLGKDVEVRHRRGNDQRPDSRRGASHHRWGSKITLMIIFIITLSTHMIIYSTSREEIVKTIYLYSEHIEIYALLYLRIYISMYPSNRDTYI